MSFMQTKTPEFKSLPHYTKAIEDRTVTTLFSVAGNIDSYGDKMWPGAFAQTIQQRGSQILHLWQHDFASPPIAVVKSVREVPRDQLPESVLAVSPEVLGGAEAVSEFLDTDRANEVLTALKAGSPLQASFGFDAIKFDFEDVNGERIRNLREVRLWEVSTVLWGANDQTLAAKFLLPFDTLLSQLDTYITDLKSGARHSAADTKRLNAIHAAVIELGATNCKGMLTDDEDDDKSRADAKASLTPLYLRLKKLELTGVTT
jgi:HK97 family phage prohead protease